MRYVLCLLTWFAAAPPLRAATIELDKSGKPPVVVLAGEIEFADAERFASALGDARDGIVVLASPGGNVAAGLRIGQLLRSRNFSTLVPDQMYCASACALIWLGGNRRMMQPTARVGFHAAYVMRGGRPQETGAGNALIGAYLSRLGLSDLAIVYISSAKPQEMRWLTQSDAQQIGIAVTVVPSSRPSTPTPTLAPDLRQIPSVQRDTAPQPGPGSRLALDGQASAFVDKYFAAWSENNKRALQAFDGFYAASVTLYGRSLMRSDVLRQKADFTQRWPERVYAIRGPTLTFACDNAARTCKASGIVDWDTRSPERRERSVGAAKFELLIDFAGGSPLIVSEAGSVISRDVSSTQ